MESITALSRGWLVDIHGFNGSVIAALPGSVYIASDVAGSDLLVVHDAAHGHTPTSVHVDRRALTVVAPGDRVAGRAGHLRVGSIVIDVRTAGVWHPPDPRPAPIAANLTQRFADLCSARHLSCVLDADLASLFDTIVGTDHDRNAEVRAALTRVIGHGPGLTPAGDDAVVGMLAVLHRASAPAVSRPMIEALRGSLPDVLDRTTPISAHYLRLAARGAFTERLIVLVDTLCDRALPHDALIGAFDDVLATGATSGADALGGIALTLRRLSRSVELQHGVTHDLEDVA